MTNSAPEPLRISFRIGINLGDVIIDGADVYGDGVNIAARLEGLSEPGGIVVSGTAYEHVNKKLDVVFKSLGDQHLKNIAEPVRAYSVVFDGVSHPTAIRLRNWQMLGQGSRSFSSRSQGYRSGASGSFPDKRPQSIRQHPLKGNLRLPSSHLRASVMMQSRTISRMGSPTISLPTYRRSRVSLSSPATRYSLSRTKIGTHATSRPS